MVAVERRVVTITVDYVHDPVPDLRYRCPARLEVEGDPQPEPLGLIEEERMARSSKPPRPHHEATTTSTPASRICRAWAATTSGRPVTVQPKRRVEVRADVVGRLQNDSAAVTLGIEDRVGRVKPLPVGLRVAVPGVVEDVDLSFPTSSAGGLAPSEPHPAIASSATHETITARRVGNPSCAPWSQLSRLQSNSPSPARDVKFRSDGPHLVILG